MPRRVDGRVAWGCLVAALGVVLGACTSADDAFKQHGEKARAAVARMSEMRADLASRPRVVADERVTIGDGPWRVSPSIFDVDVAVLYEEDLAAPGEIGNVDPRLPAPTSLSDCAALLAHKTKAWSPKEPERWKESLTGDEVATMLETCTKLRAAFVLRVTDAVPPNNAHAVVEPTADAGARDAGAPADAGAVRAKAPVRTTATARVDAGADAGAPAPAPAADAGPATAETCRAPGLACVFDGGYQRVEVHVYSFAPFAHRGAFVFEAASTSSVDVGRYAPDYVLTTDLANELGRAFREAVQKNVVGVTISGWGAP